MEIRHPTDASRRGANRVERRMAARSRIPDPAGGHQRDAIQEATMLGFDALGIPLHPLVVHFPVVLSVLLPISALVALWAIRRGTTPRSAWALPVAIAAALTLSAYAAIETGEREEDRVEQVVGDAAIHDHEEAAERFLVVSGVVLVVSGVGLVRRTVGEAARLLGAAGAVGLLALGVQVGHGGGALVYRHGAASAYTDSLRTRPAGADAAAATAAAPRRSADVDPDGRAGTDDR
jgi:uncharacterized membrane protein